jgi:uncharacterized protein (DUF58 family)
MPDAPSSTPLLDPAFLHKLEQLELVSRKIFAGRMKGERRSKRRGASVEFADHRAYTVGDDLRHIDWNAYVRLDRLFLKLFLEEEDLHVYTLLDTSPSMDFGDPTKLHYARQVAAALTFIGLVNSDRVAIDTFGADLQPGLAGLRSRSQMSRVVRFLETLTPSDAGDLTTACRSFALKHPGKGIVVILSDFLDKRGYDQALRYLLARDMDVHLIQILAPEEVEPSLVGDLRLVDSEDSEAAEISVSAPLLRRYRQNLDAYTSGLQDWCTRRGIGYLLTTTDQPFDRLVLNYLRRRGLIK